MMQLRRIAVTTALGMLSVGAAALLLAASAGPAAADGGTVSVRTTYQVPGNPEPHTECPFQVLLTGYAPNQTVTLDLRAVAPTTPEGQSVYHQDLTVDSNGNLTVTVSSADLNLTGISTYPNDSDAFNLRLDPSAGSAPDAVFYAGDCGPGTPTTTTTSTTSTTEMPTTTTPTTAGGVAPEIATTSTTVEVLGETITRNSPAVAPAAAPAAAPAQVLGQSLAKTGPEHLSGMVELAGALLALGLLVVLLALKRPAAD